MSEERNLIIVTGFGPFLGHEEVNASWEAVQMLPNEVNYQGVDYIVEKRLVPVEYRAVDEAVTEIWERQPLLVIHCGVSGVAKCVYVEKLAYNHKFRRPDNTGQYLPNGSISLPHHNKNNVLFCGLNIDKIVDVVNSEYNECTAEAAPPYINNQKMQATKVSKNVGSFLCGYIYIKSLDISKERSLFVHVPPIDTPFTKFQTGDILLKIIKQCIQQVVACNQK
ncbi:pyroglutamyl-peptidase 1 [Scaptodrosophila lebanonensis]|uniref:Pyroglutamyl-peptidase 1 n=1 Tax=Drosophila lebanonensis TaxID=7225 RepID=A0A6J2TJX9_DROLE|nr:pyroglutamyl-peptidase 1 [Scaptodrosophila lebanonensis]